MNEYSLHDIQDFLKIFYFDSPSLLVTPIPKGEENQNFKIEVDDKFYVLRVYSQAHSTTGVRNEKEIEFELDFMDHVRQKGVPTAIPIKNHFGRQVSEILLNGLPHFAVLMNYINGKEALAYSSENARLMAIQLVNMHKASLTYGYSAVRPWPGDIVRSGLTFYKENREHIGLHRNELDALYNQVAEGYKVIQSLKLPVGIVHGDIKLENVLFEKNEISGVLDFDDYRESFLLEELTRTLMHDLDSVDRNVIRSGQLGVFYEVFRMDNNISHIQLRQMDTFLKARFLYDMAAYSKNGLTWLIENIFTDLCIKKILLS